MRRRLALVLVTALLSASAMAAAAPATAPAPAPTPPPAKDETGKVQTSSDVSKESLEGAATAPLRDLNVLRTKIPSVLVDASADPYARPAKLKKPTKNAQCAQLASLIQPLDEALGADIDNPAETKEGMMDRGRETAFGAMAAFASDAIPFRGWVRKLSGAERHDRYVQQAITAGAVRRAYLKGLGESHGCSPPATPSHVLTEAQAKAKAESQAPTPPARAQGQGQASDSGRHPHYPIR